MNNSQRTFATKPVSDGLARELGRMFEDAARKYSGGAQQAELVKGNPDLIKRTYQLWDELATEQALRLPNTEQPIWKTIQLGTGLKSSKDFCTAIEKAGGQVSDWAKDIMSQKDFTVATKPTELGLVVISVKELGFSNGATHKDIYNKAKTLGLELCPPEVGPQLRLQYMDQPKGEWLRIAAEPITDSGGDPLIFSVEHDDGDLWLNFSYGSPGSVWVAGRHWVFCRRK